MDIEAFYTENYRIVYGYLLSLCGDAHWAEDLTSETFLRAILRIGSYDGRVKASTWLCTIGRNLYRNEAKKQNRQVSLEGMELRGKYTLEESYIRFQSARQISRLVEELGEPKNRVVTMRLQGMSFRDIGDALGKSENWARVTFFRAKEKLIERLEELQ